jgi:hypothetical protein
MSTIIMGDFTYDITTLRGIIRLNSRDIDGQNPVNKDSEVDAMLMMTGSLEIPTKAWDISMISIIYLAAANCFDLMAADAAKVAIIEKIGAISENTKVTYDALKEEAALLRARASRDFVPGVSLMPDPLYTPPWLAVPSTGLRGCFTSLDTW